MTNFYPIIKTEIIRVMEADYQCPDGPPQMLCPSCLAAYIARAINLAVLDEG